VGCNLARKRKSDRFKSKLDEAFRQAGRGLGKAEASIRSSLKKKGIERDAEQFIAYLNDEVVPAVRKGSSGALRAAAKHFADLADYLDQQRKK
jgi:hypothetical protein